MVVCRSRGGFSDSRALGIRQEQGPWPSEYLLTLQKYYITACELIQLIVSNMSDYISPSEPE